MHRKIATIESTVREEATTIALPKGAFALEEQRVIARRATAINSSTPMLHMRTYPTLASVALDGLKQEKHVALRRTVHPAFQKNVLKAKAVMEV